MTGLGGNTKRQNTDKRLVRVTLFKSGLNVFGRRAIGHFNIDGLQDTAAHRHQMR